MPHCSTYFLDLVIKEKNHLVRLCYKISIYLTHIDKGHVNFYHHHSSGPFWSFPAQFLDYMEQNVAVMAFLKQRVYLSEAEIQIYANEMDPLWEGASRRPKRGNCLKRMLYSIIRMYRFKCHQKEVPVSILVRVLGG